MRWSVWRRGGDDGVLMSEAEFEQRWDLVDKYEKMTDSRARCWWGRFTSHARGFISRTDCFPKQCSIYRMLRTSFKPLYWIQSILSEWHSNPARHYLIFYFYFFIAATGLILKNLGGSSFMHVSHKSQPETLRSRLEFRIMFPPCISRLLTIISYWDLRGVPPFLCLHIMFSCCPYALNILLNMISQKELGHGYCSL